MRQLFLIILFLPLLAFSQKDIKEIKGKWQETSRESKNNKTIAFKDTMRLEIRPEGFMMVRYDIGPTYFGDANITHGAINIKDKAFVIQEKEDDNMTLIDNDGVHYFKKVNDFTASPVNKFIPEKENGVIDLSFDKIKGKWTVYKKTDPNFSRTKFYLKSINFLEEKNVGTYTGNAAFSLMDSLFTVDAFIYFKENHFIISFDEDTFNATVIKSDGEEMILESGSAHYFLKQFGKKE